MKKDKIHNFEANGSQYIKLLTIFLPIHWFFFSIYYPNKIILFYMSQ